MVVTAVPVTSEVWPRALDAHSLAILPRAAEALLAPVAQVLPRVHASNRHAYPHDRRSTRVEPYPDDWEEPIAVGTKLPFQKYKAVADQVAGPHLHHGS
jgi:hypothetical protein